MSPEAFLVPIGHPGFPLGAHVRGMFARIDLRFLGDQRTSDVLKGLLLRAHAEEQLGDTSDHHDRDADEESRRQLTRLAALHAFEARV